MMDEEKYKYISEKFTKIAVKATEEVLKIADETGEDRDKLACIFVEAMHDMVCSSTFSRYKFK